MNTTSTDIALDYDIITEALEAASAEIKGAEAHGMVCGLVCANAKQDGFNRLEPFLSNRDNLPQESREVLLGLYAQSWQKIQGIDFDFQPILPDDDNALKLRAESLANFCTGFLFGLQLSGINTKDESYSADLREAIATITDIAHLDNDDTGYHDEDEWAYMELVEYVRLAVMLVFTEITANVQNHLNTGKEALH